MALTVNYPTTTAWGLAYTATADGVAIVSNRGTSRAEICVSAATPDSTFVGHIIESNGDASNIPIRLVSGEKIYAKGNSGIIVIT